MTLRNAVFTLLLIGIPSSASARPVLEHASPATGSFVRKGPGQLLLSFNQALLPSGSDAVVRNASGGVISSGKSLLLGDKTKLQVPLSSLPPGKYRVEWYATSADRSHSQGSFTFVVGDDEGTAKAGVRTRKARAR
jgi:methionine-rich copper-binding protein CopC